MKTQEDPNFGCMVFLLLFALLFCGMAIAYTDDLEEERQDAKIEYYQECRLCW